MQDLHVREAFNVHLASQSPLFTQKMQRLSTTDISRPAELMQAAVTLFKDTLPRSAREVLGSKKCMQGRRHARWMPELRLLIDRRRVIYIEARRAQEQGWCSVSLCIPPTEVCLHTGSDYNTSAQKT